jgi:hypothetical protein
MGGYYTITYYRGLDRKAKPLGKKVVHISTPIGLAMGVGNIPPVVRKLAVDSCPPNALSYTVRSSFRKEITRRNLNGIQSF